MRRHRTEKQGGQLSKRIYRTAAAEPARLRLLKALARRVLPPHLVRLPPRQRLQHARQLAVHPIPIHRCLPRRVHLLLLLLRHMFTETELTNIHEILLGTTPQDRTCPAISDASSQSATLCPARSSSIRNRVSSSCACSATSFHIFPSSSLASAASYADACCAVCQHKQPVKEGLYKQSNPSQKVS